MPPKRNVGQGKKNASEKSQSDGACAADASTSTSAPRRGKKKASERIASAGLCAADASTSTSAPRTIEDSLLARRIIKETHKAQVRKEYVARKRLKQLERQLLPDVPPRKRARKTSPVRSACRLVPGTPSTPPPPKPTAKRQRQLTLTKSDAPSTRTLSENAALPSETASESASSLLMCDWTTGDLRLGDMLQGLCSGRCGARLGIQVVDSAAASTSQQSPSPTSYFSDSVAPPSDQFVIKKGFAKKNNPADPLPSSSGQSQGINVDAETDQEIVINFLDEMSDTENDEELLLPVVDTVNFDYANEEPAFEHEQLDFKETGWLTQHDSETDQLLRTMLTGDQLTFEWTNDAASFLGQREEFRGQCGPTFLIDDNTKPVDVFLKYFTEVLDVIVSETNRHQASIVRPLKEHSRFHHLKETDRSEIAIFTAVLIFQGLCPLPVEKDFWAENGYLTLKYFKSLMTYDRFVLLKKLINFTDSDASTDMKTLDEVKLRKLGPLLNILNRKFSELYLPSRDIAIDESLLKWHGRLSFAQKIATKAAKVGVKTYELCESSTGYLWKFFIYTGKGETHGQTDMDEQDKEQTDENKHVPTNATAQIVIKLVKPLLNRGHTLTMDNFYNSPLLARYLKANGTDCLGTLRVNREFVPESIKSVSKSELRPGEIVQTYCRDMNILLWRDNNLVAMISTFHKGEIGGKEKYGHYKYKPQAVLDYNLSMGGVDRKDQLLSAHPIERTRNQAWYKKVYRRLLNVTILNSYIVYKTQFPRVSQRQFRHTLANELVAMFKPPAIERPRDVQVLRVIRNGTRKRCILTGNHFVGEGSSRFTRCVLCKKTRTKYICKQCEVSLCLKECFEKYHTKG